MTVVSLKAMALEAQAKGFKTFDPGYPCSRGHAAHRFATGMRRCVDCVSIDAEILRAKTGKERQNKYLNFLDGSEYVSQIITRKDALEKGLKFFFTGKPCKRGHFSKRFIIHRACVECSFENAREETRKRRIKARQDQKIRDLNSPYYELIISKYDAIEQGLSRYFTGKPCKNGHICERKVRKNECVECVREQLRIAHARKVVKNNILPRDHLIRLDNGHYIGRPCKVCGCVNRNTNKNCTDCISKWRKENKKSIAAYAKKSRAKFAKTKTEKTIKERFPNGSPHWFPYYVIRQERKKNATPNWLTWEQRCEIKQFFRDKPDGHHTDHIVPLAGGDKVCGLHVVWNLQYLPAAENVRKKNKWPTCQRSMQPACFDNLDNGVRKDA